MKQHIVSVEEIAGYINESILTIAVQGAAKRFEVLLRSDSPPRFRITLDGTLYFRRDLAEAVKLYNEGFRPYGHPQPDQE